MKDAIFVESNAHSFDIDKFESQIENLRSELEYKDATIKNFDSKFAMAKKE